MRLGLLLAGGYLAYGSYLNKQKRVALLPKPPRQKTKPQSHHRDCPPGYFDPGTGDCIASPQKLKQMQEGIIG